MSGDKGLQGPTVDVGFADGVEPELDDRHGPCQCGAPLQAHVGGRCPAKPAAPATIDDATGEVVLRTRCR